MALFEKQGLSAASCEPFEEWCVQNGVDNSISAVADDRPTHRAWNRLILATEEAIAQQALNELRALEASERY